MKRITNKTEAEQINSPCLRSYIESKIETLLSEYSVETLADIGCFVVLDRDETEKFDLAHMEFVEVVHIENEVYLHGVKIISDNYGKDTFLPIGVVEC